MREMIYGGQKGVLDHGVISNIEYYIYSCGSHPSAYIKLPKDTDIDLMVHGGITYGPGQPLPWMNENEADDGYWWGWDYAHYGDLFYPGINSDRAREGRIWTVKKIFMEDVAPAIFQALGASIDLGE